MVWVSVTAVPGGYIFVSDHGDIELIDKGTKKVSKAGNITFHLPDIFDGGRVVSVALTRYQDLLIVCAGKSKSVLLLLSSQTLELITKEVIGNHLATCASLVGPSKISRNAEELYGKLLSSDEESEHKGVVSHFARHPARLLEKSHSTADLPPQGLPRSPSQKFFKMSDPKVSVSTLQMRQHFGPKSSPLASAQPASSKIQPEDGSEKTGTSVLGRVKTRRNLRAKISEVATLPGVLLITPKALALAPSYLIVGTSCAQVLVYKVTGDKRFAALSTLDAALPDDLEVLQQPVTQIQQVSAVRGNHAYSPGVTATSHDRILVFHESFVSEWRIQASEDAQSADVRFTFVGYVTFEESALGVISRATILYFPAQVSPSRFAEKNRKFFGIDQASGVAPGAESQDLGISILGKKTLSENGAERHGHRDCDLCIPLIAISDVDGRLLILAPVRGPGGEASAAPAEAGAGQVSRRVLQPACTAHVSLPEDEEAVSFAQMFSYGVEISGLLSGKTALFGSSFVSTHSQCPDTSLHQTFHPTLKAYFDVAGLAARAWPGSLVMVSTAEMGNRSKVAVLAPEMVNVHTDEDYLMYPDDFRAYAREESAKQGRSPDPLLSALLFTDKTPEFRFSMEQFMTTLEEGVFECGSLSTYGNLTLRSDRGLLSHRILSSKLSAPGEFRPNYLLLSDSVGTLAERTEIATAEKNRRKNEAKSRVMALIRTRRRLGMVASTPNLHADLPKMTPIKKNIDQEVSVLSGLLFSCEANDAEGVFSNAHKLVKMLDAENKSELANELCNRRAGVWSVVSSFAGRALGRMVAKDMLAKGVQSVSRSPSKKRGGDEDFMNVSNAAAVCAVLLDSVARQNETRLSVSLRKAHDKTGSTPLHDFLFGYCREVVKLVEPVFGNLPARRAVLEKIETILVDGKRLVASSGEEREVVYFSVLEPIVSSFDLVAGYFNPEKEARHPLGKEGYLRRLITLGTESDLERKLGWNTKGTRLDHKWDANRTSSPLAIANRAGLTPLHVMTILSIIQDGVFLEQSEKDKEEEEEEEERKEDASGSDAVTKGEEEDASFLGSSGALEARDPIGCTAFHLAAMLGLPESTRALSQARPAPNAESIADNGNSVLFSAVTSQIGTDDQVYDVVSILAKDLKCDLSRTLENGFTAARVAMELGRLKVAQMLAKVGNEPLPSGKTRELLKFREAPLAVLRYIQAHPDADVNIKDTHGRTPLHWAAHAGHVELVSELLDRKADVNALDANRTSPLLLALKYKNIAAARAILDAGASVTAVDADGLCSGRLALALTNARDNQLGAKQRRTALLLARDVCLAWDQQQREIPSDWLPVAVTSGDVTIVSALLQFGVNNLYQFDDRGFTPLGAALELLRWGANENKKEVVDSAVAVLQVLFAAGAIAEKPTNQQKMTFPEHLHTMQRLMDISIVKKVKEMSRKGRQKLETQLGALFVSSKEQAAKKPAQVICEGVLDKRVGRWPVYRRRDFVLTETHLLEFKIKVRGKYRDWGTRASGIPSRVIVLAGCVPERIKPVGDRSFKIVIPRKVGAGTPVVKGPTRVYPDNVTVIFRAGSMFERDEWFANVQTVVEK